MIGLALLILGAEVDADCRRVRSDHHVRSCELKRGKGEVLESAVRPPMRRLGEGALRFSTSPALGGPAAIVEIVPLSKGGAEVRSFSFYGHARHGWSRAGSARFVLPRDEHSRFSSEVDAALSPHRLSSEELESPSLSDPEGPDIIVCTDGPGYLIERMRGTEVETLAGSCPLDSDSPHANVIIACRLRMILRRHLKEAQRPDLSTRKRCDGISQTDVLPTPSP